MKLKPGISLLMSAFMLLGTACQSAPPAQPTAAPARPTTAPAQPTAAPAQPTPAAAQAPTAAPAAQPAGQKVTITYWNGFTGGDRPTFEALFKQFNDTHPNIELKVDIQPWDSIAQKLPAALATGQGPDIATPDYNVGTIRQYAKNGLILPLDDLYASGAGKIDRAAIPKGLVDGFSVDGTLYAAPANFATLLLYYNKDAFAEAGIAAPPRTMDEFRDAAQKLTKLDASGNVMQFGIALPERQTIANWPILIWADGGDLLDAKGCSALGDPKTIAAVKSWADLIVNKKISPVGETGQGSDNLFAAKKAAMEINGPWAAGQYKGAGVNFDVAPVPNGSAGAVTLASTVPMVVNKSTKNKAAVYEFLSWWTSKEAQATLAVGAGFPPVRTDMAGDATLAQNPLVPKFAAAAPSSRLYLATVDKFAQIDTDIISPAIARATRGEPADAVLKDAAGKMNTLIGGGCQ